MLNNFYSAFCSPYINEGSFVYSLNFIRLMNSSSRSIRSSISSPLELNSEDNSSHTPGSFIPHSTPISNLADMTENSIEIVSPTDSSIPRIPSSSATPPTAPLSTANSIRGSESDTLEGSSSRGDGSSSFMIVLQNICNYFSDAFYSLRSASNAPIVINPPSPHWTSIDWSPVTLSMTLEQLQNFSMLSPAQRMLPLIIGDYFSSYSIWLFHFITHPLGYAFTGGIAAFILDYHDVTNLHDFLSGLMTSSFCITQSVFYFVFSESCAFVGDLPLVSFVDASANLAAANVIQDVISQHAVSRDVLNRDSPLQVHRALFIIMKYGVIVWDASLNFHSLNYTFILNSYHLYCIIGLITPANYLNPMVHGDFLEIFFQVMLVLGDIDAEAMRDDSIDED